MKSENEQFSEALRIVEILENNTTILQTDNPQLLNFANKVRYLNWSLQKSEPNLFSEAEVRFLLKGLDNLYSVSETLLKSPQSVVLSDYDNPINELLLKFSPPRNIIVENDDVDQIINRARINTKEITEGFEKEAQHLKSQLATSKRRQATLDKQISDLQLLLSEQKGQISNLSGVFKTEFSGVIDQVRAENKVQRDDFEVRFTKISNDIEQNHSSFIQERRSVLEEQISELIDGVTDARQKSEELVKEINGLYGIAGSNVMSGDLLKQAKDEREEYKFFSKVAIWLYIASPLSLILLVFFNDIDLNDYMSLIKRLPVAALFLLPAFFVSGIASRHRRVEIDLRSLGLRLAAFEPYLAQLSEEQQSNLRTEMAEKFFNYKISNEKHGDLNSKQLGKQLEGLISPIDSLMEMLKKHTKVS
ncbi:hypothetical protein [Pseudovibrio sp. Alg231-02]|uniref:hypothetical protein n=1 Tax=Pseudovibrio sp. Alg231-02 TaxID=1922223 RepID=UPI000D562B7C|nr:hypothetical protein [Pseudovibrio sp. Alg231-02]